MLLNRDKKSPSNKTLNITVLDTERLISVTQGRPPLLVEADLVAVGAPEAKQPQILLSSDAFSKINTHTNSDLSHEVGGFLIGRPYEWEGQIYVEISTALPGEGTTSSAVHLTITQDTWARAQTMVRKEFPGQHIVGWYHTHPKMAVFLSSLDISIHEGFFKEPWHVALVIEPAKQEAGFFVWHEGKIVVAEGYYLNNSGQTSATERWQAPSPLATGVGTRKLEDFYEVGYWHTRWRAPDEIAVKVSNKVMKLIHEQSISSSESAIGLCLGYIYQNLSTEGPHRLIEVNDIQPILSDKSSENSDTTPMIQQKMVDAAQRGEFLRTVGLYWLAPEPKPSLSYLYTKFHENTSQKFWYILLGGDPEHGVEVCFWRQTNGEFSERRLVEMLALPELSGDDLDKMLATIGEVCRQTLTNSTSPTDRSSTEDVKDQI